VVVEQPVPAGKTILAVRLVLDLLARRDPGGPVPVLVPLPSWDPAREGLWAWLERRLCLDHPALRAPAPGGGRKVRWARALWDAGLLLPVLDGLDEIAEPARGRALVRVNEALRPGVGLVLTARTGPYRAVVHPDGGVPGVVLSGVAGIQLCPLDTTVVTDYLRDSAGGPASQARWGPVLAAVADPAQPVGQTLTSPLMATLARTIYRPPVRRAGRRPAGSGRAPRPGAGHAGGAGATPAGRVPPGGLPAAPRPGAALPVGAGQGAALAGFPRRPSRTPGDH
jgi:hypothetical protein